MKVKDMIAKLATMNPEAEIAWEDNDGRNHEYLFLTRIEDARTTKDPEIVIVWTQGYVIDNPDYEGKS